MIAGRTKTANAVGGKTARACDSCVRKRARWYCAADDAFLCHTCDASVHSANQLAGRHERVLLETTASSNYKLFAASPEPTWHQGLTRKARTPRRQRSKCSPLKLEGAANSNSVRLVPEMGVVEASLLDDDDDDDEQLLYRVPVFDPFETELCNLDDGFDDHDLELMEFAADVESLLGKGFDDTSCRNIDDLGLTNSCNYNYKEEYDNNTNINIGMICFEEHRSVKVEEKEEVEEAIDVDASGGRETLVLNCDSFDYEPTMMMMIKEEEDEKKVVNDEKENMMMMMMVHSTKSSSSSIISLRLNYEDVINTWGDQGSPWTNGIRPQLNSDGFCWSDSMEESWWVGNKTTNPNSYGRNGDDGGREARVSRYREKRRRRLFSKKIRYQVRKLNAEKRPRMKGRFVKREGN